MQNKMVQSGTRRQIGEGRADKKLKGKDCWKIEDIDDFSSTDPYKIETKLQEEDDSVLGVIKG